MSTILIVGYEGEYGAKIYQQLSGHNSNIVTGVDINNLCELQKKKQYDFCLIVTPPRTHSFYINYIANHQLSKNIFCEKPIIDTNSIQNNNYRIIDHYLYKDDLQNMSKYFEENFYDTNIIKLVMNEERNENRSWMIFNKDEGGVTLDMGHHLVTIFGYLIGFENLTNIKDMRLKEVKFFNDCNIYCDEYVSFSFKYKHIFVNIEYGKNLINKKEVVFCTKEREKIFSLTGNVNYNSILSDKSKLLSPTQLNFINNILNSVLSSLNN